jgi:hypothetical protein
LAGFQGGVNTPMAPFEASGARSDLLAFETVHHYRSTLWGSLGQQFRYGVGLRDFVLNTPDHFAMLPRTPRRALRFASNLVLRPLRKALQADSTAQLPAYLPVLFLLNAAYTAGVTAGCRAAARWCPLPGRP